MECLNSLHSWCSLSLRMHQNNKIHRESKVLRVEILTQDHLIRGNLNRRKLMLILFSTKLSLRCFSAIGKSFLLDQGIFWNFLNIKEITENVLMDQVDISKKHVDSISLKYRLFSAEKRGSLSSMWTLSVPSTCRWHLESFKQA